MIWRTLASHGVVVSILLLLSSPGVDGSKDKEAAKQKTTSPMPTISPRPTGTPTISPQPTLSPAPTAVESETPTTTPTTLGPTPLDSEAPTDLPTTLEPSRAPSTESPTNPPVTLLPSTMAPSTSPVTSAPTESTIALELPVITITLQEFRRLQTQLHKERLQSFEFVVETFLYDYFTNRYTNSFCCLDTMYATGPDFSTTVTGTAKFYSKSESVPSPAALQRTLVTYFNFWGTQDLQRQTERAGLMPVESVALNGVPARMEMMGDLSSNTNAIANPFVITGVAVASIVLLGMALLMALKFHQHHRRADEDDTAQEVAEDMEAPAGKTKDRDNDDEYGDPAITSTAEDDDDEEEEDGGGIQIPQPSYIRPYGGGATVSSRNSVASRKEEEGSLDLDDGVESSYTSDGDIVSIASSLNTAQRGPLFGSDANPFKGWAKSVRKTK